MTSNIYLTPSFKRAVKKLKKRYPRIQNDVRVGVELLESRPTLGDTIPESDGIRKIRLPNSDAKRGKRGGYRMLYYYEDEETESLFLLFIYSKSDQEDVTSNYLERLHDDLADMVTEMESDEDEDYEE